MPEIALLYGYLLTILNAHSRAFQKKRPTALRDNGARCPGRFGARVTTESIAFSPEKIRVLTPISPRQ